MTAALIRGSKPVATVAWHSSEVSRRRAMPPAAGRSRRCNRTCAPFGALAAELRALLAPRARRTRCRRCRRTLQATRASAHASGCFGRVGAAPAHGSCTANASLDAGGRSTSAAYSSAGSACCRTLCTVAAGFFCGPAASDDAVLEGKHASRASPRRASRRQPGSRKAGS